MWPIDLLEAQLALLDTNQSGVNKLEVNYIHMLSVSAEIEIYVV